MKPKSKRPGKAKTAGYKPLQQYWGMQPRDMPLFQALYHVPIMMLEPTVRLGLAMRAGPLCQVEFAYKQGEEWKPGIEAEDEMLGAFVERNLKRIWTGYIGGLLDAQKWGWAASEVVMKQTSAGDVEVAELLHRQAGDVRPITSNGKVCGVRFMRIAGTEKGYVDVPTPYAIWHAFRPEPGQYFGASICKGAFSPFWDKWMEGGALDVRRLFMHKDAYGGVDISYPDGTTEIPSADGSTSTSTPNGNIAREMAEQVKAGGVTTRPSDIDPISGKERWTITRASVPANPAHILTYPKDLDTEIYRGMEIPDDVLESTEGAGGAWAGKTVPQGAFYTGLELWLRGLIGDIKPVIDYLVKLKYGRARWYEITTKPLALQATESQGKDKTPQAGPSPFGAQDPFRMSLEAIGRGLPAGPFVRGAKKLRRAAKQKRMAIDEPHQFSSTQFNLPGDLAFEVRMLGERIAADDLADDGRELNPHVTVKYGLNADSPDDVRAIVESLPPVAVQLGPVSVFEGENYDVVKIEIESKGLRELNAAIAELPNGDVHPEYKPHCTIAYVRKGLGEMYAARLNDLEGRVAVFDRLIFSNKNREHTSILLGGKPKRFGLNGKHRRPASAANR